MDKDIIMEALTRFQEIVAHDRPSAKMMPSDRRLARLAIKKYTKTVAWRTGLPRYNKSNRHGLVT